MVENGVSTSAWDVFGFSFYPFYGTAATFDNLRTPLNTLSEEYRKPIQVVETDYPAICNGEYNPIPESSGPEIPYSIPGQTIWTDDVISIVQQVPYGLGRGVHYWGTYLGSTFLPIREFLVPLEILSPFIFSSDICSRDMSQVLQLKSIPKK
jgi:arabinogalactan endo-1,4-beta-galactosidase